MAMLLHAYFTRNSRTDTAALLLLQIWYLQGGIWIADSLRMAGLSSNQLRAGLYMLLNILSATCIVFANKLVLSVYKFHFVYALTLIHTVTTMVRPHATSECSRIAQDYTHTRGFKRCRVPAFMWPSAPCSCTYLLGDQQDHDLVCSAGWDVDLLQHWVVSEQGTEGNAGGCCTHTLWPVMHAPLHGHFCHALLNLTKCHGVTSGRLEPVQDKADSKVYERMDGRMNRLMLPEGRWMHMQILPMAAAFVGYIVFWNLSLQLNSVGFYQLSKILIAPAIIIIEAVWFKKVPSRLELSAVGVLCLGVTLATVSDSEVRCYFKNLKRRCCLSKTYICVVTALMSFPQTLTCMAGTQFAQCPDVLDASDMNILRLYSYIERRPACVEVLDGVICQPFS